MKLYFATISELSTPEQCDSITNLIKEREWGFWHHIGNSWLVVTDDEVSTAEIRDTILERAPDCITLVIEFTVHDWAALSPTSSHQWLERYLVTSAQAPLLPGIESGWRRTAQD